MYCSPCFLFPISITRQVVYMTIPSINVYLPPEAHDLGFDSFYELNYRSHMGPVPLVEKFGLEESGIVQGKFNVWRYRPCGVSLGFRDLKVLQPFAIPIPVSNIISLECIISGGSDLELCGHERPDTGMPRAYLASHPENSHITRIFKAGDRVRSAGLFIPPALLLDEFGLDLEKCPPVIQNIIKMRGKLTTTLPLTGRLLNMLDELIDMPFAGMRAERYMEAKILEWLCLLCELLTAPEQEFKDDNLLSNKKAQSIKRVVGILNNNIAAAPGLDELASQVGLSRTSLANAFKSSFGITMSNYLVQRRMDLARQLLRSGKQSILQVGLTVGYENQSAFGRAYKKFFGHPPKEDLPR